MPVLQIETNVDDMDPRLWPQVIDAVLQAGALDVWVTPIIMKKGRPAFTLSALTEATQADAVRSAIFQHTTTIGLREFAVTRQVLDRRETAVTVQGHTIGVKQAFLDGELVNQSVEWDDVVSAASELGVAAKEVLAAATVVARQQEV